ncbi:RES family NAD+ phosphorylase [Bryobacter aggregatus]|uniref:RES family NAD+ phosphorylase n=1 Tax=Bryobacter aggregatus TaxID=360054 RepID=UPI0004E0FA78|nr:RES family NAD+ phosphorylase [Bryobacter aggregatus]
MPPSEELAPAILEARRNGRYTPWRAVEAQHVVSTLRLTNNDPVRQDLLERILEETKPPAPPATTGLHYLLATPFRYPPSPYGSRFRAFPDPGVLYGAAERRTACAEMGYWRWRFTQQSAGLAEIPAAPQTVFRFGVAGRTINLQTPPLTQWAETWLQTENYADTQSLARLARELDIQVIRYRSVRDPIRATNYAVLDPMALRPQSPLERETWYLTITQTGAIWQREHERFVFEF